MLVARLWNDALKARERALQASGRVCRELDVQLLDQTVALRRMRPARDAGGRLRLRREYGFEFTLEGSERRRGTVLMLGVRVESVHLDHPEGPMVVPAGRYVSPASSQLGVRSGEG